MRVRQVVLSMCAAILVATTILPIHQPRKVFANHNTSQCKWDSPWPRSVEYYIAPSFSSAEAARVTYGAGTWNGWGFNLSFQRVTSMAASEGYVSSINEGTWIGKGNLSGNAKARATWTYSVNSGGNDCNRDAGRPIIRAKIIFNTTGWVYNLDCAANYSTCLADNSPDWHDVAAHEFGHLFWMNDVCDWDGAEQQCGLPDSYMTLATRRPAGWTERRSLHSHDRYGACKMYGYESGASC